MSNVMSDVVATRKDIYMPEAATLVNVVPMTGMESFSLGHLDTPSLQQPTDGLVHLFRPGAFRAHPADQCMHLFPLLLCQLLLPLMSVEPRMLGHRDPASEKQSDQDQTGR